MQTMRVNSSLLMGSLILLLMGACATPFKKGLKSFEQAKYEEAIKYFEEAQAEKGKETAATEYYIAESLRKSNRIGEAESHYKKALDANSNEDNARFFYAYALKANGKYEEAKQRFELYTRNPGSPEYLKLAQNELKSFDKIKEILDTKTYYEVENCEGLNTASGEFAPMPYQNKLLFSATRKPDTYLGNGQGFAGIYATDAQNWQQEADKFDEKIFMDGVNEASPTFAHDGSFMIFARSSNGDKGGSNEVDLYIARYNFDEKTWEEPEIMPYPVNINETLYKTGVESLRGSRGDYWTACPEITPDGKRLYFASNRPGGYGGTDIWVGDLSTGGRVTSIRNIGNTVNTPGDELFPFVSNEGVLYFASNGHVGIGRLDIFEAIRIDGRVQIKNMGVPLNSRADDFALVFSDDSTGFFASNREGGKGDDDIYQFRDVTPDKKLVNYFLTVEVVGIDPTDTTKTETPLKDVQLRVFQGNEFKRGNKLQELVSTAAGKTDTFAVAMPEDYLITADAGLEYFKKELDYTTSGKALPKELLSKPETDTVLVAKIVLEKIVKEVAYKIEINFDFNQARIRPDAAAELDKFVTFLKDNPQIDVELGSHTDAVGSFENNLTLSQRRADSTVAYLVKKGINAQRLTAKGYGESQLKIDTQEANEANRRTEFKIVNINRNIRRNEED